MEQIVAAAEPLLARHDVLLVEGLVPGTAPGPASRALVRSFAPVRYT